MSQTLSVEEWIDKALEIGRKQLRHFPWPAKNTFYAWRTLKGLREPDQSRGADFDDFFTHDSNLACAEHYMFARWIVSVLPLSAPIVAFMSATYQLYKLSSLVSKRCANVDLSIKSGHGPVTPPSAMQLYWEMRGVQRGLFDAPVIGPFPNPEFAYSLGQEIFSLAKDMGWAGNATVPTAP